MGWYSRFRVPLVLFAIVTVAVSIAFAVEPQPLSYQASTPTIVIGFVGGFVSHDNPHHGPVQLAQHVREALPVGTYVRVFENRHRKQAYSAVLRELDSNHDGALSSEEKSRARIVLFGQSWGASAVVMLARDLRRQGVPVLLTVQVDSVAKLWQNDSLIPDNVAEAVNFYQTHGLVHGRRRIVAEDSSKTDILGNYLVDYRKNPVSCPNASWADRFFTPSHMQSECDPHLWSQIEGMVRQQLLSQDKDTSTTSTYTDPSTLNSR